MIVISDNTNPSYDGNITTVNGLYRVEASNLSAFSSTTQDITSYALPVTFANAGNCQGIILPLISGSNTVNRPVTVTLQQNILGTWTNTLATKTLTALEISASQVLGSTIELYSTRNGFLRPFRFAIPIAVDTTASKWRFNITSTAGTSAWLLKMTTTGVPSFATWCDNQVTFTSGTDQFIAMDTLYLDSALTLAGALQPSDTVNSIAGWVCSNTDRDIANICKLQWYPTPASSYKVTCNGLILIPEAGGFRAGTSGTPIPIASMGNIEFVPAVVGTNTTNVGSGFASMRPANVCGINIFIYGEIPAVEDTELAANGTTGQPTITTKVATGWNIGDTVSIGMPTTRGNSGNTIYTIQSISGTSITFTGNLTQTYIYDATTGDGASVVRLNGYGFKINSTNSTGTAIRTQRPANFVISGCQLENINWYINQGSPSSGQRIGTDIEQGLYHTSVSASTASIATPYLTPTDGSGQGINPPFMGIKYFHANFVKMTALAKMFTSNGQGLMTIDNCIFLYSDSYVGQTANNISGKWTYTNNKNEGTSFTHLLAQGNFNTFRNNRFWGNSSGGSSGSGALRVSNAFFTTDWSGNTFDNNSVAINFSSGTSFGNSSTGDRFNKILANSIDVYQYFNSLHLFTFYNPIGTLSKAIITRGVQQGTNMAFVSENQILNNDSLLRQEGTITHTGYGLADTTVWTGTAFGVASAGQFGMRLAPYNGTTNLLTYQDNGGVTTIGNVQNKTVTVTLRVKINNAAYYAGVHTLPTLKVTYDGVTTVSSIASANTNDQQLQVIFTPTTDRQDIKIELNCQTAATGTNAYVYFGEILVGLPSGISVDTSTLSSWANALPLGYTKTFASPASAWDEPISAHGVAGSFGMLEKNTNSMIE